jgi:formamidopyrimidine-DNA glycosylase
LKPFVVGQRITGVTLFSEKMVRQPSPEEFRDRVVGREIRDISRRGKYLIFSLDSGEALIIHLKMTGSLLVKQGSEKPEKLIRAIISLSNGTAIHFRDLRKFGKMWLEADSGAIDKKLGVEPFSAEFTSRWLADKLKNRSTPIKALLLDQSLVAGVGNMYADEALFVAKIHPERSAGSLSAEEIERLHRAIRQVLRAGIKNKGASVDTYFRPDGSEGIAHTEFKVAHRKGEKCPVCGAPIVRIAVRQRGTYFCPCCQPKS